MVFLFFMITDPRTIPASRVGRVVFGLLVAATSTLLMAPQTDEFGTKVGLLAGLMVVSAFRPFLDRLLPEAKSPADNLRAFLGRLGTGGGRIPKVAGAVAAVVVVLAYGTGVIVAGGPARALAVGTSSEEILARQPSQVDPATLPPITIGQDVVDFNSVVAEPATMQAILVTVAQNLELENQALLHHDASLLAAVDHGDRLAQMQATLAAASPTGSIVLEHYRFASVQVRTLVPFGVQTGISLGLDSTGAVVTETYDPSGRFLLSTASAPFHLVFATRQALGDRWLTVAVLQP
jgi:hypothetical protein